MIEEGDDKRIIFVAIPTLLNSPLILLLALLLKWRRETDVKRPKNVLKNHIHVTAVGFEIWQESLPLGAAALFPRQYPRLIVEENIRTACRRNNLTTALPSMSKT